MTRGVGYGYDAGNQTIQSKEGKLMEEKILVAYATTYGSTQEIAEAVADALRAAGQAVHCLAMRRVPSLVGYRAVVLGAPLYLFHWHKDALRFVARQREALSRLPVAVFTLGPFNDKEEEWQEVRGEIDKELAKFPWLNPVRVQVFGGRFDPTRLRLPWSLVPAMRNMPASDIRDWAAIRAWGEGLVPLLARAGETLAEGAQ
jgi:menaquinone-dependent protoporphyrinogen oxidase